MSLKIKVLIIDDELPARKKTRAFLSELDEIGEIREAENGIEAVTAIKETKPDIVFLDIQMPGMTGFEVIKEIGVENMPITVFVTAYDEYAVNAFEVKAIDYLLKPYDQTRFLKSFRRALSQFQLKSVNIENLKETLKLLTEERKISDKFLVSEGNRFIFVKAGEIIHISAEEKYVRLHTANRQHLLRSTMNKMEEKLEPEIFCRIHRSYIINTNFIKEISPLSHGDYMVVLTDGTKIPMSRNYKNRLMGKEK